MNLEQPSSKNKTWEDTLKQVRLTIDKLSKPIDKNIEEAVVALTINGIHTTASCEGHIEHGTYAPYIDIETSEISDFDNQLKQADSKEKAKKIFDEIKRKNLEERRKLINLLEKFYEKRTVPFERRLIVQSKARGWSRLESQGAGLQEIQPEEVKKQKLEEYKKEVAEFTAFLKNKYFE